MALATAVAADSALSAQDVDVDARMEGNALAIDAHATIRGSVPLIWRTLTDYEHLAEFVPGMKKSHAAR